MSDYRETLERWLNALESLSQEEVEKLVREALAEVEDLYARIDWLANSDAEREEENKALRLSRKRAWDERDEALAKIEAALEENEDVSRSWEDTVYAMVEALKDGRE